METWIFAPSLIFGPPWAWSKPPALLPISFDAAACCYAFYAFYALGDYFPLCSTFVQFHHCDWVLWRLPHDTWIRWYLGTLLCTLLTWYFDSSSLISCSHSHGTKMTAMAYPNLLLVYQGIKVTVSHVRLDTLVKFRLTCDPLIPWQWTVCVLIMWNLDAQTLTSWVPQYLRIRQCRLSRETVGMLLSPAWSAPERAGLRVVSSRALWHHGYGHGHGHGHGINIVLLSWPGV